MNGVISNDLQWLSKISNAGSRYLSATTELLVLVGLLSAWSSSEKIEYDAADGPLSYTALDNLVLVSVKTTQATVSMLICNNSGIVPIVGHFPHGHIPPDNFPRQFSSPGAFSPAVKANIWKLALTRTLNPSRSISINFAHVNGRSLYIVYRRMVMVEGETSYVM